MSSLPYKLFKVRHPEYDANYWKLCYALYVGGKQLLHDKHMLEQVLPRHIAEEDSVYEERKKRAFYIPYLGSVIDYLIAGLSSDPISIEPAQQMAHEGEDGSKPKSPTKKLDPFYIDFFKDTSRRGGRKIPLNQLLRKQMTTALLCKRAWTLVDLPTQTGDLDGSETLAEQEAAGLLEAYAVAIPPECVIDYCEDDQEELLWALIQRVANEREDLTADRSLVTETYTYYTQSTWQRYEITYDPDKNPPKDDTLVELVDGGDHSFGMVPLLPMELPDGLYAGSKLESIAIAHFNQRNALSWGEYRSLFQFLAAFLEEGDPTKQITEDANRAVNQRIGPGRMMVFSDKDDVRFIGPDSQAFVFAAEDLNNLRDEMFRVIYAMAMSVDNRGAAVRRSAESKKQDHGITGVVLKALGEIMRDHAREIYQTLAKGRQDEIDYDLVIRGADEFDEINIEAFIEEAATLETIVIPSETFQREYKLVLAKRALGGHASDDIIAKIKEELESNLTKEFFTGMMAMATGGATAAPGAKPAVPVIGPAARGPVRPQGGRSKTGGSK